MFPKLFLLEEINFLLALHVASCIAPVSAHIHHPTMSTSWQFFEYKRRVKRNNKSLLPQFQFVLWVLLLLLFDGTTVWWSVLLYVFDDKLMMSSVSAEACQWFLGNPCSVCWSGCWCLVLTLERLKNCLYIDRVSYFYY